MRILFTILCLFLLALSTHVLGASESLQLSIQNLVNQRTPIEDAFTIDLPFVAEDGSSIPLSIDLTALSQDDPIKSLHIFATKNPNHEVIDIHFNQPDIANKIATRIRLNESQTVIAFAQSYSDKVYQAQRDVRVTVSGCLAPGQQGQGGIAMSTPRIGLPRNAKAGVPAEIKTLINHPMETGFREDSSGQLIDRNIVESLRISHKNDPVIEVTFHTGTSANPYFSFYLDQFSDLQFLWQDELGQTILERR